MKPPKGGDYEAPPLGWGVGRGDYEAPLVWGVGTTKPLLGLFTTKY